jgi:hypothetical protein
MAAGGIAVAATLALGVAGASAAPNPGPGYSGSLATGTDVAPNGGHGLVTDGPQTANVPTLAWAGEAVRLVACDPVIYPGSNSPGVAETAEWSTENWTGDQAFADVPTFDGQSAYQPLNFQGGSDGFFPATDLPENQGKGCVDAVIKSTHAGLWQGKLNVYGYDQTEYTEQFIVIWMTVASTNITESSVNSLEYPDGSTTQQITTTPGLGNVTGAQCFDDNSYDDSGLPLSGAFNCLGYLGDPSGNGVFNPSLWPSRCDDGLSTDGGCRGTLANNTPDGNNGLLDVRVTGSFPVEDQPPATSNLVKFGSIDGGTNPGTITLPTQWAALAGLLADSSTVGSTPGSNPSLWDIHGGPTNPDTHPVITSSSTPCPPDTFGAVELAGVDAVNNCLGSQFYFSRVFGDVTSGATAPGWSGSGENPGPTVGPYDDEAPNETLLSDGRLNADDAPMPALPVTVSIAANKGGTDLGGVGGLYSANKEVIYSHNFDGNESTLGNLYNPYYYEYIPSTSRDYYESSGVTGIAGDDFPGFDLINSQPYKFWTALDPKSNNTDTSTICLRRTDAGHDGDSGPYYYGEPDSYEADSVIVYTDERGQAFVDYNPGTGFYLDSLITPYPVSTVKGGTNPAGPITIDGNQACDLQPLLGKVIGTSAITASPEYPYQGVNYPNPPQSSLTKTVTSLWNKTLSAYPKGNAAPGADTSVFVTSATDINGEPLAGEEVCFSVQGTGSGAFTGQIMPYEDIVENSAGTIVADTDGQRYDGTTGNDVCVQSNWLGEAAVEVEGSVPNVDVSAYFVDEKLYRDLSTTLGGSSTSTGVPPSGATVIPEAAPVAAAGGTGSSSTITAAPSATPSVTPLAVQKAKPASVCKVESLHLLRGKRGKYAVSFKLGCSSSKSLSVTIRAYKANGKLLRSFRLTLATNKTVTVGVGTKVAHVTVIA